MAPQPLRKRRPVRVPVSAKLRASLRRRLELLLIAFALVWAPGGALAADGWGVPEGTVVPKTTLMTASGEKIELTGYAAKQKKKNLLLVFFRTGTCGVCVGQLTELAAVFDNITAENAAVLAVSLDDAIVQKMTSEKIQGKYPILLDPDGKTVKWFDVFNPDDKLARPAIFLIGPKGKVLYKYVGKHLSDRPTMPALMDLLAHYSGGLPKARARNLSGK